MPAYNHPDGVEALKHLRGWEWTTMDRVGAPGGYERFLEYKEGISFEDFLLQLLLRRDPEYNPCTGFKKPCTCPTNLRGCNCGTLNEYKRTHQTL